MYRLCELANEAFGRSCMKWEGLAVDRLVLTRLTLRMRRDGHELVLVARESSGTSLVYDVRLGGASGRAIGRIYRVPISPQDRPWFWALTAATSLRSTQRGYERTREDAMAAFKRAWQGE